MSGAREENVRRSGGAGRARWALAAAVAVAATVSAAGCPLTDDYVISGGAKPPTGSGCPGACTGGCPGGVCHIDCAGVQVCEGTTITCPEGYPCVVDCVGTQACQQSQIYCPEEHACTVVCAGLEACLTTAVHCGITGTCDLSCGIDYACRFTNLYCGTGDCDATCPPNQPAENLPAVTCYPMSSCACNPC